MLTDVRNRPTVLPDNNIWDYWVAANAIERVRRAAKGAQVDIVACPAVVYEMLRDGDPGRRRRRARAMTRDSWVRPMPEAFVEAEDVRKEMAAHHPDWLLRRPDLSSWQLNEADWRGDFWTRVRREPDRMSRIVTELPGGDLSAARAQASGDRDLVPVRANLSSLQLDKATAALRPPAPGWDGQPFEAWRGHSLQYWTDALFNGGNDTSREWLAPWLNTRLIAMSASAWVTFWTQEARSTAMPREWIRWAMREVQAFKKFTPGTPVDNQIATYLVDHDVFLTADKGFVECIEAIRPYAPVALATTSLSPGGDASVDHALRLLRETDGVKEGHA